MCFPTGVGVSPSAAMLSRVFVVFCLVSSVHFHLLEVAHGEESVPEECKSVDGYKLFDCCKYPDELEKEKKYMETREACRKAIVGDKKIPEDIAEMQQLAECMEECFLNATNQLTPDMKLNVAAIKEQFAQHFVKSPKWKDVAWKAVDVCIGKDLSSQLKPDAKCKSGALQMGNCLTKHIFLDCPEEDWQSKEEECKEAKELVEKCMPILPS